MGDPRRMKRTWTGPKNPWRTEDLREALRLIGEYGLRNKKELYKAASIAREYRKQARGMLALTDAERVTVEKALVLRLFKRGLIKYENATSDTILSLTSKDVLERRLQTVVYRKGLAQTIHQARQMVAHGHIVLGDRVVNIPGYLVSTSDEEKIAITSSSPMYAAFLNRTSSQNKAAPVTVNSGESS